MAKPYNPKKVGIAITVLVLVIFYLFRWLFSGSDDGFTPEQINSILQNKQKDIVKITKTELSNQSLKSPYLQPDSYKVKNWDVKGNSIVKNHDYFRLTSDHPRQVGNMFSTLPIQADSFEMELTFHIHSKSSSLFADGFAIWFLDSISEIGDVFGSKNYFNGLGIMIDTYKNGKRGQFPFVNLMLGDGNTFYNKGNDGHDTRLAGCNVQLIVNPPSGFTKARIVYIKNGYFSLDFNFDGKSEHWTNCVTLTDIKLPPIKYLGLSAETGEVTQAVDIIENKMFALYKPDGSFISSIEELQDLIQQQDENNKIYKDELSSPSSNSKPKRQTRRSVRRLRKAEERIKERERKRRLNKYGDEEMNGFKWFFQGILTMLKYCLCLLIAIIIIWFAFIIFRVFKQNRRTKVTGLLD